MELRIKNYIENCLEMARFDIKIYKKFMGYNNKFWLEDAEKYMNFADLALEYNMLPSELKTEKLEHKEPKKLIKVEVIE